MPGSFQISGLQGFVGSTGVPFEGVPLPGYPKVLRVFATGYRGPPMERGY